MGYIRFTDSDKQNILLCPHCYERTRHIQVSLSETFSSDPKASDTMKNVGRIIGGMSDIIRYNRDSPHSKVYWKSLHLEMYRMWNHYNTEKGWSNLKNF